ncbi:UNVERIFIED_CONTAM: hypothetical protein FKN15_033213 [Acipenser sinensis]
METEGSPKKESSAAANLGDGDAEANEQSGHEDGGNSSSRCQASVSNGGDTDDGKETVDLKIIWNKNKYDLRIPLDATGASLKERIHSLTGLPPSMQKVMYKGLLPEDKTLREIKVTNGAKVMVVGSTINDVLAVNTPKGVIQQEVKAEENKKEPLCQQKERLPTVPLSGMYNKSGGKVRLTFKLEQDQLWIGTKERTEKLPMGSIKNVVTEPIEGHDDYHMMAYNNNIPEDQLKLLGGTSRVASVSDINSWTITTLDTLSALMKSEDGRWDADKSAAIITKYLGAGKTLDAVALKATGSESLCSLSVSQLKTITGPNLLDAGALDISSCTPEKKKELYNTASAALISQRSDVLTYYNFIKPYLGGAPLEEVQRIAHQNINMDITTFKNLDKDVILKLSPDTVRTLLGSNLRDLESQVNDPVIKEWMSRQVQSTLNSLGVSGVIGIPDPLPSGVLTLPKPVSAGVNLIAPRVLQTLFIGVLIAALQNIL